MTLTKQVSEGSDGKTAGAAVGAADYAIRMDGESPNGHSRFGDFLLAEMEQQELGIAEFTRKSGIGYAVVQRWIDPDHSKRMLPSSANCHRIADALKIDEDEVLLAAGHRRPRKVRSTPLPPFQEELHAMLRRVERYLQATPVEEWSPLMRPTLEAHIDQIRVLVERLIERTDH